MASQVVKVDRLQIGSSVFALIQKDCENRAFHAILQYNNITVRCAGELWVYPQFRRGLRRWIRSLHFILIVKLYLERFPTAG